MSTLLSLSGCAEFLQILLQTTATKWPNHNPNPDYLYLQLFIPVVLIKYLEKHNLKEKDLLKAQSSRVKFTMTDASEKQKSEGTGHMPSTDRKKSEKCSLHLNFLLSQSRITGRRWSHVSGGCPHLSWGL